jgi:hypothetical protein
MIWIFSEGNDRNKPIIVSSVYNSIIKQFILIGVES